MRAKLHEQARPSNIQGYRMHIRKIAGTLPVILRTSTQYERDY